MEQEIDLAEAEKLKRPGLRSWTARLHSFLFRTALPFCSFSLFSLFLKTAQLWEADEASSPRESKSSSDNTDDCDFIGTFDVYRVAAYTHSILFLNDFSDFANMRLRARHRDPPLCVLRNVRSYRYTGAHVRVAVQCT